MWFTHAPHTCCLASRGGRGRAAGGSPEGGGLGGPEASGRVGGLPAQPRCQTRGALAASPRCSPSCSPQVLACGLNVNQTSQEQRGRRANVKRKICEGRSRRVVGADWPCVVARAAARRCWPVCSRKGNRVGKAGRGEKRVGNDWSCAVAWAAECRCWPSHDRNTAPGLGSGLGFGVHGY